MHLQALSAFVLAWLHATISLLVSPCMTMEWFSCSDEEEGIAEMQQLLKRVMSHRKATSRKKEMHIVQVRFCNASIRPASLCKKECHR